MNFRKLKEILKILYLKNLIPDCVIPLSYRKKLKASSVFINRKIKWSSAGYWYLYPMPSDLELNEYYEHMYWQIRSKSEGIEARDIDHFKLLEGFGVFNSSNPVVFCNFGAGHGGISHLFHIFGNKVINVEPSPIALNYPQNWVTVQSLDHVNEPIDIFYGSHSLEHVANIDSHFAKVCSLLKPNGFVFYEVPNGSIDCDNGKIHHGKPPHTYYFTRDFFYRLPFNVLLNKTYKEGEFPYQSRDDNSGEVIRYLGQKQK